MGEPALKLEAAQPSAESVARKGALYLGHHWRIQKGTAPTHVVAFKMDGRPDWYCARMDARDKADAIALTVERIAAARDPLVVDGRFELRPLVPPDKLPRLARVGNDETGTESA